MSDAGDFADLGREFRGIDAPADALLRAVERGRRRLVRGKLIGLALSVLLGAFAVFVVWRDHDAASLVFAGMQLGVMTAVMAFTSYSSRHAWQARSETTRGFLELEVERRRDWIRRMRFLRLLIPVLAVVMAVHQSLTVHRHPFPPTTIPALFDYALPYLIVAALFWHAGNRKARYAGEERALSHQLAELDAPA